MTKSCGVLPVLLWFLILVLQSRMLGASESLRDDPSSSYFQQMSTADLFDALKKDPKNEDLCYYAMVLYGKQKMYKNVITLATRAKKENVSSARILEMAAEAFFLLADYQNCLTALGLLEKKLSGDV